MFSLSWNVAEAIKTKMMALRPWNRLIDASSYMRKVSVTPVQLSKFETSISLV
jgi:hypothetical protein